MMVGREGWKAYSSLSDEGKREVRNTFLNLLKKYANKKGIDEEMKREIKFRKKLVSHDNIDTLYFLVNDDVYYAWKYLDRQKRKEIEEGVIRKIMELSNDMKIEEYLKKRAEGNGDARLAKKVIQKSL